MNASVAMQGGFASALLDPARQLVGLGDGQDVARGLAVHRNNMMVALVDALASTFPVVRTLVGEAFFATMARDFVRGDPPRSPIIAAYGEGFADFIADYAPAAGVVYLADLARLERLRGEAFNAADAQAIDVARWTALLADNDRLAKMRVRLQPACRWLSSAHPVLSIWQAHQHGADAPRDAALAALDVTIGEDVLVHRPQWDVQQVLLPAAGIAWLESLRAGATLGDALHVASVNAPSTAPDQLFALLLQHGLVASMTFQRDL